ncbi:MAG: hypothetical protein ACRDEB_09545, partial [Chitinophagaceae bacterium]
MTGQLTLTVLEIIVLMLGAIILGITIHFFIVSRRSLNESIDETPGGRIRKEFSAWKLKYFNDIEQRDKEINLIKLQLAESLENYSNLAIEAEEKGIKNKKLQAEIESIQSNASTEDKPGYTEQLRQAQISLLEHNKKINQLLGQINFATEAEKKQMKMLNANEELSSQVNELKAILAQKEKEISSIRQQEKLTAEMTSLLDSTYN